MNAPVLPLEEEATPSVLCAHCEKPFAPRNGGGTKQKFCSAKCRYDFHNQHDRVDSVGSVYTHETEPPSTPIAAEQAPTSGEFDWNGTNVVLREQRETAIYFNRQGDLVIRQRADWDREEDPFVVICANNIDDFLDKLTDACGIPSVGKRR